MSTLSAQRYLDKIVLITGGTKGLGLATAHRLYDEGATVLICSSKADNVQAALKTFTKIG